MTISIIAAVSENSVIGNDNKLIWHISEDLKHFKKLTFGRPVIMGRKTFESLGKPLPGRTNIVITRNAGFEAEGCVTVNSLDEALAAADGSDPFVIGGQSIYEAAEPIADVLYITRIHADCEGDTFFPEISDEWIEVERTDFDCGKNFVYPFSFIKYIRQTD